MENALAKAFHIVLLAKRSTELERTRRLFVIAHAMSNETTTNIRSLYYEFPDLFPTADAAHRAVRWICGKTGITLNQLKMQATAKGLYYAMGEEFLIDDNLEIENPPKRLLVLEKDTIFQKFKSLDCFPFDLAMVTGKGFPDYKTLQFVARWYGRSQVFGLCDCNASGERILLQYARVCQHFEPLGLFEGCGGKQHDEKRIKALQRDLTADGRPDWAAELERMLGGSQGELDDLIREQGEQWLLEQILGMISGISEKSAMSCNL